MADNSFRYRGKTYDIEEKDEFVHIYEDDKEIGLYQRDEKGSALCTDPSSLTERGEQKLFEYLCDKY